MSLRPWMKWYPADWRSDPKLRMCSLAARGLWADLIALMHEAEPYGHLVVAGKAPNDKQLASLVGSTQREVTALIDELSEAEVFSRTDGDVIYSRRMVRDKDKSDQDAENGKRGGNPKLRREDNGGVNPQDKAHKPEARSQKPDRIPPVPSGPPPLAEPSDLSTPESPAGEAPPSVASEPVSASEIAAPAPPPAKLDDDDLDIPAFADRTNEGEAVRRWNSTAERLGLPQVQKLTDKRRRSLRRRLEDCGGLDGWDAALGKLADSAFLRGENDRGWRADFDFMVTESKFTKLMEGGYDDDPSGGGNGGAMRRAFEDLHREIDGGTTQ